MFEASTQLTETDLKKIADMLTHDQLCQIIARHTLRTERAILDEVLSDIENNDADEILHARKLVRDPVALASTCISISAEMESFVEDAIKQIAPEYTVN